MENSWELTFKTNVVEVIESATLIESTAEDSNVIELHASRETSNLASQQRGPHEDMSDLVARAFLSAVDHSI